MSIDIRLPTETLLESLKAVKAVAREQKSIPILNHVLIEARTDDVERIAVTATDLNTTIRIVRPATVRSPGSICLPYDEAMDLVSVVDGNELHLHLGSRPSEVILQSGDETCSCYGMHGDEFPGTEAVEGLPFTDLPSEAFALMLDRTLYCASTDETRYNLNSSFFEGEVDEDGCLLRLTSTDGHRLSSAEHRVKTGGLEGDALLPRAATCVVRALLRSHKDKTAFGMHFTDKGETVFRVGHAFVSAKLVDGTFPDYRQIVPKREKASTIVTVDREALLRATKKALKVSKEILKLEMEEGGDLIVSGVNVGTSKVSTRVSCLAKGKGLTLKLNAIYLEQALSKIDGEKVMVWSADNMSPVLIEAAGLPEDCHISVIMPVRS